MEQSIKDVLKMQLEIESLEKQLGELSKDSDTVKKALSFRDELNQLLEKHNFNYDDLVEMLQIEPPKTEKKRTRKYFIYRNPHTGEVVRTRGGNHVTLKEWRKKYGPEAVDSWKEEDDKG